MSTLPENWNEMTHIEKQKFFFRNYVLFGREGEIIGLNDFTPEDVAAEYEKWKEEEDGRF